MELLYKPNADEALRRWDAFWAGDMLDRPPVCHTALRREGTGPLPPLHQLTGFDWNFAGIAEDIEANLAALYFVAESFPGFGPSLGPDQFAGYLGCRIRLNEASGDTSWVELCVKDWASALPVHLDPSNRYWKQMLEFCAYLRPRAAGKFLVGVQDLHSNMDALAAMRGYEQMCLDMVDVPELIDEAVTQVRAIYPAVYDGFYEAAGLGEVGYTAPWAALVAPGKGNMVQCDFSALMSPRMFNRWVMPCLEDETSYLDHCAYHLDGPDALCHVPSLMTLAGLHVMQWTIGDGLIDSRPPSTWIELYQQFQAAGKACQIGGPVEMLKEIHPQLKPNLIHYVVEARSVAEVEEFLQWLVENS